MLLNEVNAKAKEVNDLKKKNSDLAGVVHISGVKLGNLEGERNLQKMQH